MNKLPSHIYHFRGKVGGPTVVILGSVHGNERMGIKVIEALKGLLAGEKIKGEIFLIVGNPAAYERDVRFVDCDLNRLFGKSFAELRDQTQLNIEEKRALEIGPILAKADYSLDIHSTIKKSVPFVFCENTTAHIALAGLFETEFIVSPTPDYRGIKSHSATDSFVDRHGGVGLTYETGWHKDESSLQFVIEKAKLFLKKVGAAFLELPDPVGSSAAKHIFMYKEVVAASDNFTFSRDYENFSFVSAGEILATDNVPIVIGCDSYVLFPKLDIGAGKPACYLCRSNKA